MPDAERTALSSNLPPPPKAGMQAGMAQVLAQLLSGGDVDTALLASSDGLVRAHACDDRMSPDKLAAMGSALVALCEAAAEEAGHGVCGEVIVEASRGRLLSMSVEVAGEPCVLLVGSAASKPLGKVLWAARSAVAALRRLA